MFWNKRGQFFLLAAVVISLVIISLAATTNNVVVKADNFEEIDDFSYQVQRETGEVLNFEIYRGITGDRIEEFTEIMAEEIQDKDPEVEFVFIFGDNEKTTVQNYAEEPLEISEGDVSEDYIYCENVGGVFVFAENGCYGNGCYICVGIDTCSEFNSESGCYLVGTAPAANIIGGTVNTGSSTTDVEGGYRESEEYVLTSEDLDSGYITVFVLDEDGNKVPVVIPVSEYKQVYLITKRTEGNETYFDY